MINIEYHLAPETKFPVQLMNVYDMWRSGQWRTLLNMASIHDGSLSAAAAPALICRGAVFAGASRPENRFCFQVLNYPPLDLSPARKPKGTGTGCLQRGRRRYTACYLQMSSDATITGVAANI